MSTTPGYRPRADILMSDLNATALRDLSALGTVDELIGAGLVEERVVRQPNGKADETFPRYALVVTFAGFDAIGRG